MVRALSLGRFAVYLSRRADLPAEVGVTRGYRFAEAKAGRTALGLCWGW